MRLDMYTSDWHHLIKPVLPHTSRDKEAVHLQRVRLELGPRALYATATDRYTLAVERHVLQPADQFGDWPPVEIEQTELKASLGLLKFDKDYDPPVQVTVDQAPVPLEGGRSVMSWAVTICRPDDGLRLILRDRRSPDRDQSGWRTAIRTAMTRAKGRSLDGLDIPARLLARWKDAARGTEQLRVWTGPEPGDPLLIVVEQHFAGIMTAHQQLDDPARERSVLPWAAELSEMQPETRVIDLRTASDVHVSVDTGSGEVLDDNGDGAEEAAGA